MAAGGQNRTAEIAFRACSGPIAVLASRCRGALRSRIVSQQMRTYHLRLYKRRSGGMPLYDHVRSIHLKANDGEEAVELARVAEIRDHLGDCAIVFDDRGEVVALWHLREVP